MGDILSRRELLRNAALGTAALMLPGRLVACTNPDPDLLRLRSWTGALRDESGSEHHGEIGPSAARVGELAAGTPYVPFTLEAYLENGGTPKEEPLTLSLTHFDCVTLVESCIGIARIARGRAELSWKGFGQTIEQMRYRGGKRRGYSSRLHYFSEWITDGATRGLVRDLGAELGAGEDTRPLRFMTEHRDKYPALADESVFRKVQAIEQGLDRHPRRVVPTKRIPQVVEGIESGDVLAFATEIPGLDVTHTALAHRGKDGILRVLHAPLSGGVVEVTRRTLPEYVAAIRRSTGILVARPL